MSRLSNTKILAALEAGTVKIEPFHMDQLNNVSYDLTLGRWVARFKGAGRFRRLAVDDPLDRYVVEFHSSDEKERLAAAALWFDHDSAARVRFEPIADDEIGWDPGELLLAVTREVCGGRETITADLGAPSGVGRHAMTACRCAGIGDVGYCIHPWTLEMANDSRDTVTLPVGAVVAQAVFHDVGPILPGTSYEKRGSYGGDAPWHPITNMLPRKIKVRA